MKVKNCNEEGSCWAYKNAVDNNQPSSLPNEHYHLNEILIPCV